MLIDFDILPDKSRIWIYASESKLTEEQQRYILNNMYNHLREWKAHRLPLEAGVKIIDNHFIIVALDETKNEASGCSIDTLQHQIQKIENNLSISLLNRLNIFCILNDDITCIPSIDLKNNVDRNTLFYDLTIQKKSQISSFIKPIGEGWCARLVD